MGKGEKFRIVYIGGGSRFVMALLHGLAERAEELRPCGRCIELALVDPDTARAGEMARYAQVAAGQTGLDIRPLVTADLTEGLTGARWVIFGAGMYAMTRPLHERFPALKALHEESTPKVAVEAAALWPYLRSLAGQMRLLCPEALFSSIVNPTDVLAAAMEKAFGIASVGICVEVPQTRNWLAYYLEAPWRSIRLEYVGVNHVGWISRWSIDGVPDADALLRDRIPEAMAQPRWNPWCNAFWTIYQATGYMRSSPYHHWPFARRWDDDLARRRQACEEYQVPGGREPWRKGLLAEAFATGRMVQDEDVDYVLSWKHPYISPPIRHTLGQVAAGLAGAPGGEADEPCPLQVRNGRSNPVLPADAWIEVPTLVQEGAMLPQYVPPPPDWLFGQTVQIALQRTLLSEWLAGRDGQGLVKALFSSPEAVAVESLAELAKELPGHLSGQGGPPPR